MINFFFVLRLHQFAIRLLYKVAAGQIEELEDSREFNEQQESNETNKKDESRKLSVDSGVSIRHDFRDSLTPEKSSLMNEDENVRKNSKEPGQHHYNDSNEYPSKNKIQPSYNLRQRNR